MGGDWSLWGVGSEMDLRSEDLALLQERAGVTSETLGMLESLGFTVTRTASLLSYLKELADEAERRGASGNHTGLPAGAASAQQEPQTEHKTLRPSASREAGQTPEDPQPIKP